MVPSLSVSGLWKHIYAGMSAETSLGPGLTVLALNCLCPFHLGSRVPYKVPAGDVRERISLIRHQPESVCTGRRRGGVDLGSQVFHMLVFIGPRCFQPCTPLLCPLYLLPVSLSQGKMASLV